MILKKNMKKEDNKRKKEMRDNLDDIEKEQLRKYKKEGEKVMRNNEKEKIKKEDIKRKKRKA